MTVVEAVHAILVALTPWHGDRDVPAEERSAALYDEAVAFTTVTQRPDELAALIAQGKHDSNFALRVIRGHCDQMPVGERCDKLHARGVLQVHSWCRKAWALPDGSRESMIEEARCALRIIRHGKAVCRDTAQSPMHGAFAALAARSCGWAGADVRVATWRKVLEKLRGSS
jgi:hypothetical protein